MDKARPESQPRVRLTDARNARRWSQQEVADQLGTTHVNVSRWERGITRPSPYFRKKLSVLFGKSEPELDLASEGEGLPVNSGAAASQLPAGAGAPGQSNGATYPTPPVLYDPSIPVPPQIALVGRDLELAKLRTRLSSGGSVALTAL